MKLHVKTRIFHSVSTFYFNKLEQLCYKTKQCFPFSLFSLPLSNFNYFDFNTIPHTRETQLFHFCNMSLVSTKLERLC